MVEGGVFEMGDNNTMGKKKGSGFVWIPIASVFLIAFVVLSVVSCVNFSKSMGWGAGLSGGTSTTSNKKAKKLKSYDSVPYDEATDKCSGCEAARKDYNSIIKAYSMIHAGDPDSALYFDAAQDLKDRFYSELDHNCKAETIMVTEVPYILWNYEGIYTGEWKGNGPCGQGTFAGNYISVSNHVSEKDNSFYYYSGDWEHGLPNGSGEYWQENSRGTVDTYYIGGVKDGKRDGRGQMIEYYFYDPYDRGFYLPMVEVQYFNGEDTYLCFAEAEYRDDALVSETDVELYDNNDANRLRGSGRVVWNYNSNSFTYTEYERNLTNTEIMQNYATGIIAAALVDKTIEMLTTEDPPTISGMERNSNVYVEDYDEEFEKKKEEEERLRKEKYANEAYYWEKEHEKWMNSDPDNYHTADAEYNMNYFRRMSY
jgi:hypothetical protein